MTLDEMKQKFTTIFKTDGLPEAFFAPGRVNLIGEHTDYNGGHVFPCALDVGTYGLVQLRDDRRLRFYSENFSENGVIESSLDDLKPLEDSRWISYPMGVIWAFGKHGYPIEKGMDLYIYGNIPNGSGLSSSASLEVLTGIILKNCFYPDSVSMPQIALLGQTAENKYNGMNCGIMDQFASAMGKKDHAIFLDTNTLDYEWVPVNLGNYQLVITNSLVKHSLVSSAYNDRRRECEKGLLMLQCALDISSLGDLTDHQFEVNKHLIRDEIVQKRVRHAVSENRRTIAAVKALKENDLDTFGKLMNASHLSLRDDYEVSCPEIDTLVETAWALPYVLGSRITGGGFGGCTVSLVASDKIEDFKEALSDAYKKSCGKIPEFYSVEIGDGAHKL